MKKVLIRLKNKKIALSVISGILLILVNTGVINVEMANEWEVTVNTALSILVALGIVSDPESHVNK